MTLTLVLPIGDRVMVWRNGNKLDQLNGKQNQQLRTIESLLKAFSKNDLHP